ncbi:unnamed protein product [Prunus brigantina]
MSWELEMVRKQNLQQKFLLRNQFGYIFTSSTDVLQSVSEMSYLLAVTILLNGVQPVLSRVAVGSGWQAWVTTRRDWEKETELEWRRIDDGLCLSDPPLRLKWYKHIPWVSLMSFDHYLILWNMENQHSRSLPSIFSKCTYLVCFCSQDNNLVQIMDAWMSPPQSSQGSPLLSVAVDLSGLFTYSESFPSSSRPFSIQLYAQYLLSFFMALNMEETEHELIKFFQKTCSSPRSNRCANCAKIVASQLRGTVDRILIVLSLYLYSRFKNLRSFGLCAESTDVVIKNTITTTCNGYESPQRGPPLP